MTRRDELDRVLDGIAAAEGGRLRAGQDQRRRRSAGVNDDEIVDLAAFGREQGVEVRFIEFMPLDASGDWRDDEVVGQDEIVAASTPSSRSSRCPPAARRRPTAGATATVAGTVGVIPTVTKPFCGDCDRVRLTADGQFRTCLFATDEFDLRGAMRGGRERRRAGAANRGRRRHASGRATASTRSTSSARAGR